MRALFLEDAPCASADPDAWFSTDKGDIGYAKRVCGECPFKQECLEFAMQDPELHGVWGGKTRLERAKSRKAV